MQDFRCKLSNTELKHYVNCCVSLSFNAEKDTQKRTKIFGLNLPEGLNYHRGRSLGARKHKYYEIVINSKLPRVHLLRDVRRRPFLSATRFNLVTPTKRRSILKFNSDFSSSPKSVSFNEIVTVTPISPRKNRQSSSEDEHTSFYYRNGELTPHVNLFSCVTSTPRISNLENIENNRDSQYYKVLAAHKKMTTEEEQKSKEVETQQTESEKKEPEKEVTDTDNKSEIVVKEANESATDKKIDIEADTKAVENDVTDKHDVIEEVKEVEKDKQVTNKKIEIVIEEEEIKPAEVEKDVRIEEPPKPAEIEKDVRIEEPPKRKRGRPRKSHLDPDPPFSPFSTPKKKAIIIQKKPTPVTNEPKRKRGRPRKKVEFGFHTIVSEINTIALPSDLWSAHVSVSSRNSQVTFTRVVQAVSDCVPVECDRSVKFLGGKNYHVKMNNRAVEFIGSPKTVESLNEIEILLQIVNDITINDQVVRYIVS